jgi:metacaspase-1
MPMKALFVGINDYAPVGPGGPDLHGCVNDVRDAASTYVSLGLLAAAPSHLQILTDARATRANILAGLKWLITPTARVDQLVFFYSGHGSYMVDTNGDEVDGKDETICPHDFATAGMIKDDELRMVFTQLKPGTTLEVILDSCFSGTGTREQLAMNALPDSEKVNIRYVEPPFDQSFYVDINPKLTTRGFLKGITARQTVPVPGMNHILWSACKDNQTCAEAPINGAYRGVFSFCYFKTLRSAGLRSTRRRIDALVCSEVKKLGFSQIPQLEADPTEMDQPIMREAHAASGRG